MIRELGLAWNRFSPLEHQLFAAVRGALPPAAIPTFDAQVAAINHVQRLPPTWSEIDFYSVQGGRVRWFFLGGGRSRWPVVPSFPCTDEFRLADVSFHVSGKRYKATLSCIHGHIFDFAITPGARGVAFDPWDEAPVVHLLDDPMRAATGHKVPERIPQQWQSFLVRHHGAPPPEWTFYDAVSAYRVSLEESVYLVLAERDGPAFILQRVEPEAASLFYLRDHDGAPEEVVEGDLESLVGAAQQSVSGLPRQEEDLDASSSSSKAPFSRRRRR